MNVTTEKKIETTAEAPATPHLEVEALIYRYGLPEVMNAANEVIQKIALESQHAAFRGSVH